MSDIELKLEYTIKHTPIKYVIVRKYFWWQVCDLEGGVYYEFFWKIKAIAQCEMLNAIFNVGYATGCNAIIKTIYK